MIEEHKAVFEAVMKAKEAFYESIECKGIEYGYPVKIVAYQEFSDEEEENSYTIICSTDDRYRHTKKD